MTPLLVGDAQAVLKTLPDGIAQCCVTSPPYWGLRTYGVKGQFGLERTPEEYVARLVEVFREVRRVLRDDGTAWVNMGDSYVGSGKASGRCWENGKIPNMSQKQASNVGSLVSKMPDPAGLKPKDLCGIPWRLAFALQADGWWLRSDIIWAKPNPMPESVTDRPTKSHEYIFLLSKSKNYFYDQEAVREPTSPYSNFGGNPPLEPCPSTKGDSVNDRRIHKRLGHGSVGHPSGRNLRSIWTFPTEPYPEAHFATFPRELARRCILAGTSAKGACPECGAAWERVTQRQGQSSADYMRTRDKTRFQSEQGRKQNMRAPAEYYQRRTYTLGFRPTCSCGKDPIPCLVLDPFVGSGTTAEVAIDLDRDIIGIDLNPDYIEKYAKKRVEQAQKRQAARKQQEVLSL